MISPCSPSPRRTPSSLERTPPPSGTSASEALPALDGQVTLRDLRERAPRLPLEVTAQLENISYLFHKVRQDIRGHQEQLEHFSQLLEACSQALDTPTQEGAPDSPDAAQDQRVPCSPKTKTAQGPKVETARESNAEAPVGTKPPSPRPQLPWGPGTDTPPEPQFWQDVLTRLLWQGFASPHDTASELGGQVAGTELAPGLESKEPGSCDVGTNTGAGASTQTPQPAKAASAPEGSRDDRVSVSLAQEPVGRARPVLKLLSWDPEDLEDAAAHGRLAVPHKLDKARTLRHGELVLAAAVSSFTRHAFTCGRGGVKTPGAYLRACLLTADSRTLLVGGHNLTSVSVWDLAAPALCASDQLPCVGGTCQALAANPAENLAFASFSHGVVRTWDLRSRSVVRDLPGPRNCAKSIAIREQQVWVGGLDACLRCWDLRAAGPPLQYQLESQIMSLAHCPQEDWLLLGLANGQQWLRRPDGSQVHMAGRKDSAILALRFSAFGRWWVSVGTDDLVSIHTMPLGAKVFQVPEATAILCCDVSSDSRLVVTGAGDCASVYQVAY
ncbi:transducin-like enhancer protein 6 isoform X2 [Lepus europaeus]|uniref:transducin-like enhancer protein 6 isoform X2 n=1 Tax=Lepus europaeus TaxID=9983 RepID=UPI002B4778D2|nr:transducin-like enhancer protein 6 isoform X2 [Lepus europaeus]